MFGFSLLGGRGIALDAVLLLLLLALAVASARSYWGKDGLGVAANVATFSGAGLLFVISRWWLDEKPIRSVLVFAPLAIAAGLLLHRKVTDRKKPWIVATLAFAFVNWFLFAGLVSLVNLFPEELSDGVMRRSPDGRLEAVIVRHDNKWDSVWDTVVIRPRHPWRDPLLWPQLTAYGELRGDQVSDIRWEGSNRLIVLTELSDDDAKRVKHVPGVRVVHRAVR